jgi:hypothetical protein
MNMLPSSHSIDTAVIKMQETEMLKLVDMISAQWLWVCFFIYYITLTTARFSVAMYGDCTDLQEHSEVSEVGGRSADFT